MRPVFQVRDVNAGNGRRSIRRPRLPEQSADTHGRCVPDRSEGERGRQLGQQVGHGMFDGGLPLEPPSGYVKDCVAGIDLADRVQSAVAPRDRIQHHPSASSVRRWAPMPAVIDRPNDFQADST